MMMTMMMVMMITSSIEVMLEEANGQKAKESGQLRRRDSEWIATVQLKMHVNVQAKVGLHVATQRVQQMLHIVQGAAKKHTW